MRLHFLIPAIALSCAITGSTLWSQNDATWTDLTPPAPIARMLVKNDTAEGYTLSGSGSVAWEPAAEHSLLAYDGDERPPMGGGVVVQTQTDGEASEIHRALDQTIAIGDDEQLAVNVMVDPDPPYTEQGWEIRLYCGYPDVTDNYWSLIDLRVSENRMIAGGWNIVCPGPLKAVARAHGKPDWSSINGIGLRIFPYEGQESARFFWGPIYLVKTGLQRGKAVLTFDDGLESVYAEAFRRMQAWGYRGVAFVNGQTVGSEEGRVTLEQLHEMQDNGWDIGSHGWSHLCMQDISGEEQRDELGKNLFWLLDNGFDRGARFMALPHSRQNKMTQKILPEYHGAVRSSATSVEAAVPWPAPNPYILPGVEISDEVPRATWQSLMSNAARYKLVLILMLHNVGDIGGYGELSVENFDVLLADLDDYDLDVVTFSDLWDGSK